MEKGKSNSFKVIQCCLLCHLFPVDGSIYLGDKENTEACEVYLLDRCELTETFPSSFSPSPHSPSLFVFIKHSIYFFFPLRFKCFLIFSRLTKQHLAVEGLESPHSCGAVLTGDACVVCQVMRAICKTLGVECGGLV